MPSQNVSVILTTGHFRIVLLPRQHSCKADRLQPWQKGRSIALLPVDIHDVETTTGFDSHLEAVAHISCRVCCIFISMSHWKSIKQQYYSKNNKGAIKHSCTISYIYRFEIWCFILSKVFFLILLTWVLCVGVDRGQTIAWLISILVSMRNNLHNCYIV